ncbi:hypothetical protein ACWEVP_31800 [Amycolatopsis sp. NPDC003865]
MTVESTSEAYDLAVIEDRARERAHVAETVIKYRQTGTDVLTSVLEGREALTAPVWARVNLDLIAFLRAELARRRTGRVQVPHRSVDAPDVWVGLTVRMLDGLECVMCGVDFAVAEVSSRPVGRASVRGGAQVFACAGACEGRAEPFRPRSTTCEATSCTAYRHEHRDETWGYMGCRTCGKPAHWDSVVEDIQHDDGSSCADVTPKPWPDVVVHTFGSTGTAYDIGQCCDDIRSGDLISVPSEHVLAVMVDAWPMAVTKEAGEFHYVNQEPGQPYLDAFALLDRGKYAPSLAYALMFLAQSGNASLVKEV